MSGCSAWSKDCDVDTNTEHLAGWIPRSSPRHPHLRSSWNWRPRIEGWGAHWDPSTSPRLRTCWLPDSGCPTCLAQPGRTIQNMKLTRGLHPRLSHYSWMENQNQDTFKTAYQMPARCWVFQGFELRRCCCARDSNTEDSTTNPSSPCEWCNWIANRGRPIEASPPNSRSCWCHCILGKWIARCGIPWVTAGEKVWTLQTPPHHKGYGCSLLGCGRVMLESPTWDKPTLSLSFSISHFWHVLLMFWKQWVSLSRSQAAPPSWISKLGNRRIKHTADAKP